MGSGYIKLYRTLQDSTVWNASNSVQRDILINILLSANYTSKSWMWKGVRYTCEAGQLITSVESLRKMAWKTTTTRNVRTALAKFEKLGFLTIETTKSATLITIVNWAFWQGEMCENDKASDKEVTKNRQRGDKEVTTNKNEKNERNIYSDVFESFWTAYPRKVEKAKAYRCFKARLKEGHTADELILTAKNYAAECKAKGTEETYIKHPSTFLSKDKPFLEYREMPVPSSAVKQPKYVNFEQRDYDFAKLEKDLLNAQEGMRS